MCTYVPCCRPFYGNKLGSPQEMIFFSHKARVTHIFNKYKKIKEMKDGESGKRVKFFTKL